MKPNMIVCFYDTETNGLDPRVSLPTEVAAVKFQYNSLVKPQWELVSEFSAFIWDESYPPQTPEIVELTGITDGLLKEQGAPPALVFAEMVPYLMGVDIIVAHNAQFDRSFFEAALKRHGLLEPQFEWLCTKTNFDWPKKYSCHRLTHLALEHFIEFKMRDMHRATADCKLLQQLVALYDFDKALAYSREPFQFVVALPKPPWEDGGAQVAFVKSLGFQWEKVQWAQSKLTFYKKWVHYAKVSKIPGIIEKIAKSESPFEVFEYTQ
jgi:DNA polymerase III epsilon subunit-like protein